MLRELLLSLAVFTVYASLAVTHVDFTSINQTLVIAVGGANHSAILSDVDIFSLTTNSHINASALPGTRSEFASTIHNSTIYVIGGFDGQQPVDTFWSYDVAANKWRTDLPAYPTVMVMGAAVTLNDNIYVLGGTDGSYNNISQVYMFDILQSKWSTLATPLPQTSQFPVATAVGPSLFYLADGNVFRSDDAAESWKKLSSYNSGRISAAGVALPGANAILLAGGIVGNQIVNTAEVYNITSDQWTDVAPMQSVRDCPSAAVMVDSNNVLVCGGEMQYIKALNSCEIYDWNANRWSNSSFLLDTGRGFFSLFITQALYGLFR